VIGGEVELEIRDCAAGSCQYDDHQAMSIDPDEIFNKLMALGPPGAIGVPEAFRRIGSLIDLAGDLDKDDGIARALEWCDVLGQRKLNKKQKALLDYFGPTPGQTDSGPSIVTSTRRGSGNNQSYSSRFSISGALCNQMDSGSYRLFASAKYSPISATSSALLGGLSRRDRPGRARLRRPIRPSEWRLVIAATV
jgi:hypothetical protein